MTRRLALALTVACGLAVLVWHRSQPTGHGRSPFTEDDRYVGSGPEVAMLGDSITNSAHDRLHRELRGFASAIVSMSGEGFSGGPGTEAHGSSEPIMTVHAERFAATSPAVAVIALGTNDAWDPALIAEDPLPHLDAIFRSFDGACTVGVLVVEHPDAASYDPDRAAAINRRLRLRSDVVVDWRLHAPAIAITPDGIHLTRAGQRGFTEAVVAGVQACT